MKPLKLVMTGFESYCDTTEIDFTKLGERGLYLITGETGAGKTTIFDAITYALYSDPSGDNRTEAMLRSHFADENTPTKVSLTFEADKKIYRVERNPEYERKAKRGTGTTKEVANAVLYYESQSGIEPVTKSQAVDEEIKKILGMKKEQFCRIAMIAQGAFQKLLLAKTSEKQTIFRELFKTENYERLQKALSENQHDAASKRTSLKSSIAQYLSGIECDEDEKDFAAINDIKTKQYVDEDSLKILQDFVKNDESQIAKVKTEIAKLEKSYSEVLLQLDEYERHQNKLDELEKNKQLIKEATAQHKEALASFKKAEADYKIKPELEKEKTLLNAEVKEYKNILQKESELNQDKLKLAVLQTEIEDATKKIQDYKTKLDSLKKEFEEVKSSGEKKLEWESKKKDIDSNIQILSEIKSGLSELNKLRASYQNIIEDFNTAEANRIKAEEDLTQKRHLFNLEQAGILAQSLKDGLPCPVCGSTEHPHPADKSTDAPTEKEIEDKEKEVSLLQNSAKKKAQDASGAKTQLESLESLLEEKIKKHSPDHSLSDPDLRDFLNAADAESKAQLQLVQQMIDSESKNQQKKALIEKQIPELEQQINSLSEIHAKANTDFASLQSQIAEKEKNLIELKSKLKSENADTAQKRLVELTQKIESLDSTLENARTNKTESEKNLSSLEGAAKTISEELDKMQTHDGEQLNALRTELEQKKNELNNRRDKMTGRNKANCDSVENIARLLPEYKASDEELTMINMLYRVASGSVTGQEKVSLETYVQMAFLNRITRRANLRLKIMTDGKYELCRRTVAADKRSALGLELDVKDFYTGRTRNVESLSGGEQFEASLALALGLADEIQASEGGCKLDAMFIDEGFGTLDSETLNKAMKALEDLSRGDKLIGIISHVEELEGRIANKIRVTKDKSGKSSATVVSEF